MRAAIAANADEDEDGRRVVRRGVKSGARLLRPAVPGNAAAEEERDACRDESAFAQPRMLAAIGKDEFSDLDWNQNHPDAFESQHEKEVDPVDSGVAAEVGVGAGKGEWRDGCLLDDELLSDGEGEAEAAGGWLRRLASGERVRGREARRRPRP